MHARGIGRYFLLATLLLVVLCLGACAGNGCALEDLPEGGLPPSQTLEGGGQIRVSEAGFATLTAVVPALINESLSDGTCIDESSTSLGIGDVLYCHETDGMCDPGCHATFHVDSVEMSVPQDDQLAVTVQLDLLPTDVPVAFDPVLLKPVGCTMVATADDIVIEMIIAFGINPESGELELELLDIPEADIDIKVTECGIAGAAVNAVVNGLEAAVGNNLVRRLLRPRIEKLLQDLLPDPLGLEGVLDLSDLAQMTSDSSSRDGKAAMEVRLVPGGYVHLEGGGLSLGLISGFNADADRTTRTPDLASEAARCIPPFAVPNFAVEPHSLDTTERSSFFLDPAEVFRGNPEAAKDVLVGISETTLDQLGHHFVRSGALCLSVGKETVEQLNLGVFGLLVPSLAELGTDAGDDPMRLVLRPTNPIDATIGDGTEESPSLTLHTVDFRVDFYAFLFGRYVRGFTVAVDLDIGINVEFGTNADGKPTVLPTLVGLEAENIEVSVLNNEFLREDRQTLEAVFPSVLDLVIPLITDSLDAFVLPELAGFQLDDLSVQRVTTTLDDFLAIGGNLRASPETTEFILRTGSTNSLLEDLTRTPVSPVTAKAELVAVVAPSPRNMRSELQQLPEGQEPSVLIDLDEVDSNGRALEWTYRLGNGLWRGLRPGGTVRLTDRAFYLQGNHRLELRARVAGAPHTWSVGTTTFDLVFDSVAPRISPVLPLDEGRRYRVQASDLVAKDNLLYAFGIPGAQEPSSPWSTDSTMPTSWTQRLVERGAVEVFVEDPSGNRSQRTLLSANLTPPTGSEATAGGCSVSNDNGSLPAVFFLLIVLAVASQRRSSGEQQKTVATLLGCFLSISVTGCTCSGQSAAICALDSDCGESCGENEVGQCFEDACRCLDDIDRGRVGEFSSMAVAPDGTIWVAAYNRTHGDLVVASTTASGPIPDDSWTFVDGVPDGPVVVPSTRRNGIKAPGDDVGQGTDIAVSKDGVVYISYFDATTQSLKMATYVDGAWSIHIVDQGNSDDATASRTVGRYSAISLDKSEAPVIAYFVEVNSETDTPSSEVRFAQAQNSFPGSAADWENILVREEQIEAPSSDLLPIPQGVGLFVDLAHNPTDGTPTLVYYDRPRGDLVIARYSPKDAVFAEEILDPEGDVGWYPSLLVDEESIAHVSYVDANNHDLLYVNDRDRVVQLVDDGYRIAGTTDDGLPIPDLHFVGDDSALISTEDGLAIAYQDATTHELLLATQANDGTWVRTTIAGDEDPFTGAYGFFANAATEAEQLTLSSWVVDQPSHAAWVEIFRPTPASVE